MRKVPIIIITDNMEKLGRRYDLVVTVNRAENSMVRRNG